MASKPSRTAKSSTARPRRQYLPAEQRRQSILEAARTVFARTGLKGARTRELAEAAGINQATLFEHFESKEALFLAAVIQPMADIMEGARERTESYADAASPEELLDLLQNGLAQQLQSMVEVYPLLVQALFSDQALGKGFYREHIDPMLDDRMAMVLDFVKPGMDPKLVQLATFGMFFAVAMDQTMTGRQHDLQQVARQLSELITFGCSPLQ